MDMMPPILQGVQQLKNTINVMNNDYGDDRKNGGMGDLNKDQPKP